MKKVLYVLIAITIFSCNSNQKKEQNPVYSSIDFESVDAYFELLEQLENGKAISDKQWDTFLTLKGNQLYIDENNISSATLKLIRHEMEQSYIPENDSLLKANIGSNIRLQIRKRYQDYKHEYLKHISWLKENSEILQDSAVTLAKTYLPKSMHRLDTVPNIYIHGLWDGSASDKGIFVDIILQYDFDKRRLGSFIAHELHHFMMKSKINTEHLDKHDKGLMWAVQSIQTEAIADLVDKSTIVFKGSDWWLNTQYMALLNYAPDVIGTLNQYLEDEAQGVHHTEDAYRTALANSVGHIPGQFMAEAIKRHGLLNEVISDLENPFSFFYSYNQIANADEALPSFSENAIAFLQSLEAKYIH
ncbi:MAG: DUF5700 domain-containing putative Zn-dependent protease [Bacteroidota bacterium]